MWYAVLFLIAILFSISRNKLKRISLTLISILPIVNYNFFPRFDFKLLDVFAVIILCAYLYYNSTRKKYLITPFTYPFLFMFLTLLLSTIVAPRVDFAFWVIFTCVLFFLIAKSISFFLTDEKDITAALYCLIIPTVVSALLGIYQGMFGIHAAKLANVFNPNVITHEFLRAPGPFDDSLTFGQYLSVLVSFFIAFFLAGIRYGANRKLLLALSFATISIGIAGLISSVSRTPVATIIVIVAVSLLILYRSKGIMIVCVMLLMIVVFQDQLLNAFVSDPMAKRYLAAESDFAASRLVLWKNGFDLFLRNPIVGIGTGNLNFATRLADPSERMIPGGHIESVYVSYLVSNGIVGLVALVYLISKVLTQSYAMFKNSPDPFLKSVSFGLFAAFLSNAINMVTNPASLPGKIGAFDYACFYMFWVLLALLIVVTSRTKYSRISQNLEVK